MSQKSETTVNAKISAFVPEGALAAKRVLDRLYPGKWTQIPLVKQSLFGVHRAIQEQLGGWKARKYSLRTWAFNCEPRNA